MLDSASSPAWLSRDSAPPAGVQGGAAVLAPRILGQLCGKTKRGPIRPGQGRQGSRPADVARAKARGTVGGIPAVLSGAAMHFLHGKAVKSQQRVLINL